DLLMARGLPVLGESRAVDALPGLAGERVGIRAAGESRARDERSAALQKRSAIFHFLPLGQGRDDYRAATGRAQHATVPLTHVKSQTCLHRSPALLRAARPAFPRRRHAVVCFYRTTESRMAPWMVRKAKASWLLGFVIVLAGFFAVLLFVVQAFLPAGLLPELPRMPAVWVDGSLVRMPLNKVVQIPPQLYAGLAVAVLGLLTMLYGARIAGRQVPVLEAAKQR